MRNSKEFVKGIQRVVGLDDQTIAYELSLRGVQIDLDNGETRIILQSWFDEEKGDPSKLVQILSDKELANKLSFIRDEVRRITDLSEFLLDRDTIEKKDRLKTKTIQKWKHLYWRLFRVQDPSRKEQYKYYTILNTGRDQPGRFVRISYATKKMYYGIGHLSVTHATSKFTQFGSEHY